MILRFFRALSFTRSVSKISRDLGSKSALNIGGKATDRAIGRMKDLWQSNDLLRPVLEEHGVSPGELEEVFWNFSINGAGQWVKGYYVAVASLCYPVPLRYVLQNKNKNSIRTLVDTMLTYFQRGNPYVPVGDNKHDA